MSNLTMKIVLFLSSSFFLSACILGVKTDTDPSNDTGTLTDVGDVVDNVYDTTDARKDKDIVVVDTTNPTDSDASDITTDSEVRQDGGDTNPDSDSSDTDAKSFPPSCSDGMENETESDIDCGGPDCPKCKAGMICDNPKDCASRNCTNSVCRGATCMDGIPNGDETDVDCGGSDPNCPSCMLGKSCKKDSDCKSLFCKNGTCKNPTCSDNTQNGTETDVDCGGSDCSKCKVGDSCNSGPDCKLGYCPNGQCVKPTCSDGDKNGSETDIDCGGPDCNPCGPMKDCQQGSDCISKRCVSSGYCAKSSCSDTIQNGNETDVDCGGPDCSSCSADKNCQKNLDCKSKICDTSTQPPVCQAPTCSDGVKNQNEIVTDCGGSCPSEIKTPKALNRVKGSSTVIVSNCIKVELECLPGGNVKVKGRQSTGTDSGLKVAGDQINFSGWEIKTASNPGKKKFDLCRVPGRKPTEVDWVSHSP